MSVKSIESRQQDRTRWLIYWILFNTVSLVESLFGFCLMIVPGYTVIKNAYFAWCMYPHENNGCMVSYYVLRPFLLKPVRYIDDYLQETVHKVDIILKENNNLTAAATLTATITANGISGVIAKQNADELKKLE